MTQLAEPQAGSPQRIRFEDYLASLDEGRRAEWVDGEVILLSPASDEHQLVLKFLLKIVDDFVEANDLGLVLPPPFVMKLPGGLRGREPDLMFVGTENIGRLSATFIDGPADLAVEIVSPESGDRDRGTKFYEYERAGVREYWLIDPARRQAEFYQLGADGYFHSVLAGPDGRYHSAVLRGFWLEVGWLWQKPRPRSRDIGKLWGLS